MRQKKISVGTIYTDRYVPGNDQPGWHLLYEWEDQIAAQAGLPIGDSQRPRRIHENVVARNLVRIPGAFPLLKVFDALLARPSKSLYFTMSPQRRSSFSARANVIPIIVDFWKTVDLPYFYRTYDNCPLVLMSSLEAFNFLKSQGCPLNMHHFPLSLPDKYKATPELSYQKRYDVLMAGRSNPVLLDFVRRYEKENPELEYLYQTDHEGKLSYFSNKTGLVGAFEERASYMTLLRASRVGFYSTPGIDGGEKRTGGFNPVTPRLFELLAAECHVIARYADNDDTRFFQLQELWPSVDTYEAFAATLKGALKSGPPMERHRAYLRKHYTSTRVDLLNQILSQQN